MAFLVPSCVRDFSNAALSTVALNFHERRKKFRAGAREQRDGGLTPVFHKVRARSVGFHYYYVAAALAILRQAQDDNALFRIDWDSRWFFVEKIRSRIFRTDLLELSRRLFEVEQVAAVAPAFRPEAVGRLVGRSEPS
ncbi:MAG: hypothetical protein WBX26_13400, partial [Candidatus Cybelea sp.]